jgi:gliding motility-associated-like protein
MKNSILLILLVVFQISLVNAQMVGVNGYLKGTSVEIGIDGAGGFEGLNTTVSPPLAGMHQRSGAGIALFGFVANPQLNSWATFDGDFFTPGSPENGWGFEIPSDSISKGNNCSSLLEIPGTLSYSTNVNCLIVDWEGDFTSSTDVNFKIKYVLQNNDLFYTTTISIKNNTSDTIPELFYYRSLDPDNNQPLSFDYTTTNTVVSQPFSGSCNLAHVKATQSSPWNSYIGLAAIGSNWRATYGGFSNRDASDVWNGVGSTGATPFVQTVGVPSTNDEAIALAYRIQNLAPGATETFKFVVILDDAAATNAISNLLYFSYPGSVLAPPSACTPYTDTARTCGGPVPIGVQGPIVSNFTWTWSPTTGLSPTTGSYVTANPPVTTTYTITGTPLTSCFSPVTLSIVVQVTPATGANPYITPVPIVCTGSSPFALTVDSLGGIWTGPGITDDTLGTFDPSLAGAGSHIITYTTPGFCNTTDTVQIIVNSSASALITDPPNVCWNAPAFNLVSAGPGGVWSGAGITDSTAGTFDPAVSGSGTFTVSYTITGGACTAVDTTTVTVFPVENEPIIAPIAMQCTANAAFNLAVDSTGGTWSGPGITSASTGTFDPATAGVGTHTIVYTISGACPTDDTTTVTVNYSYDATITQPPTICYGTAPYNLNAVDTSGIWSGMGITDSIAGVFDPNVSGPGNFVLTFAISAACPATDTVTVTVGSVVTPVTGFTYDTIPVCISSGLNPLPTMVPGYTPGGTYSSGSGLAVNPATGEIDLTLSTAGTYIVTYNVPATTCGPAGTSTATITLDPVIMPVTDFTYPSIVCLSDSMVIPTLLPGFTTGGLFTSSSGLSIHDSTGTINPGASIAGTYTVNYIVTGSNSLCTGSGIGTVTITIAPRPTIGLTGEQYLWIGNSALLVASGGTTYEWNPAGTLSCALCDSTVAAPLTTTDYCVKVTDSIGCFDTSCVRVNIEIPCPTNRNLEVPNAFTPNGDGFNDQLCLYGWDDCVAEFLVTIYDRWGEKVFQSTDPSFCWDGVFRGNQLDPAVFVYFIVAKYETSGDNPLATTSLIEIVKKGNISLVR